MSSRVVGKVAITPKGTWNALSSYEKLDAVVQNNVMYIAKINVPVGTAVTDTAYWWRSIGLSSDSTDLYLFDDEELETLADEDFIPFFSTENSSGRKISWESIKNRISAFIHGIPSGGTTGQVLKKTSGVDFDVEWGDGGGSGTAGLTEISSADYDDLPDEDKQNPDIAYFLPDGVGSDVVDDELDSTSHNPVENMAITTAIATLTTNIEERMVKANPTGTGSFSLNRREGSTVGNYSFAEGRFCIASGARSHAEGASTTASGDSSHAEGSSSTASGDYSHAENFSCTASGMDSHAEGRATTASKAQSHAEGYNTKASSPQQHVQGQYNIEDASSKYADIVGWGSSDSNRANIETTDTNGVKWLKSDVRCGGTSQDDSSAISLTALNDVVGLNKTTLTVIKTIDGRAFNSSGANITDSTHTVGYISVSANTKYMLTSSRLFEYGMVVFCDANDTVLSFKAMPSTFYDAIFTTPSGCAEIKVCYLTTINSIASAQLFTTRANGISDKVDVMETDLVNLKQSSTDWTSTHSFIGETFLLTNVESSGRTLYFVHRDSCKLIVGYRTSVNITSTYNESTNVTTIVNNNGGCRMYAINLA